MWWLIAISTRPPASQQADAMGMEIRRRAGELRQMRRPVQRQDIDTVLRRRLALRHGVAVERRDEGKARFLVDRDVFRAHDAPDRRALPREARFHIGEHAIDVERAHRHADGDRRQHGSGGQCGAENGAHGQLAKARALVNCRSARRA
ncbi:MAG: hypothetical protein WDM81_17745 [Rhizomicrobium sp.]